MTITGTRSFSRVAFNLAPGMSRTMVASMMSFASALGSLWAAREWVFRPQWADLFYAISGTSLATLSHLHYVLRVCRQLLHKGLPKPGSCFPAPVKIFIGDGYARFFVCMFCPISSLCIFVTQTWWH